MFKKYIIALFLLVILVFFYNENENKKKEQRIYVFCKTLTNENPSFFDSCKKDYQLYRFIKFDLIKKINYRVEKNKTYNEQVKKINKINLKINKNSYKRTTMKDLSGPDLELKDIINKKVKFYTLIDIPPAKDVTEEGSGEIYEIKNKNVVKFYNYLPGGTIPFKFESNTGIWNIQERFTPGETETFFESRKVIKKIMQIKHCMIPIDKRVTLETMTDFDWKRVEKNHSSYIFREPENGPTTICLPKVIDPYSYYSLRYDFLYWGNKNNIKHDIFISLEGHEVRDGRIIMDDYLRIYIQDITFKEINQSPEDIFSSIVDSRIKRPMGTNFQKEIPNPVDFARIFWNQNRL